jgi:histone acetyltransferase (RNA polymerase elongator complex component)
MLDDFLRVGRKARGVQVAFADTTPAGTPPERPFIVPVFLPQAGCPHQCAFCNQHTIAARQSPQGDLAALAGAVDRFLAYRHRRQGIRQLAFYGGNFLGQAPAHVRRYLDWATTYVRRDAVDNLRFSTRPDTISPAILALIRNDPVQTIELGVQSMDDRVLAQARRGHRARDTIQAVSRLNAAGYDIGLQIMTGLPGSSPEQDEASAAAIVALKPSFVRIYPTLVLAGSPLAADYRAGRYEPPTLEAGIDLAARLWLMFTAAGIRVVRLGLQDNPALADPANVLAGPYHPAFGEQVLGRVFRAMAETALNHWGPAATRVRLRVNPRRLSMMTGPHRCNGIKLREAFRLDELRIVADADLGRNELEVDNL